VSIEQVAGCQLPATEKALVILTRILYNSNNRGVVIMSEYRNKCALCNYGKDVETLSAVMCKYKGLVQPEYSCRRFQLDYLRLNPKRRKPPDFEGFTEEDFSIL